MTQNALHADQDGQKRAYIRDGALILYFDNAETPFVARYDLESLAQANFEVADKKEGFFYLTLRDFSGSTQNIGQFSTKADAHQALYAILQALLSYKTDSKISDTGSCGVLCGLGRFLLGLLKWFLILAAAVCILYMLLSLLAPNVATHTNGNPAKISGALPGSNGSPADIKPAHPVPGPLTGLPQGEAVDADSILSDGKTPDTNAEVK